jgi:hypothetical protein
MSGATPPPDLITGWRGLVPFLTARGPECYAARAGGWPGAVSRASTVGYEVVLERLTEPFDLVESDEGGSEAGEGLVDVGASLVADRQAAEAVEPSVCALHHPPVPAQPLAAVDAAARDARHNPTRSTLMSARSGVVGFVGVQLSGRRRGRPLRPLRKAGMASRVGAIITLSCRLAPLRQTPSGVPRASVTGWRFVPALPRSVGFGPVAEPLFWPGQRRCPSSPASSQFHPPRVGAPGAPDAGGPTRRPLANRADAASNSSRSRSPSPLAASPRGCLSAAQTECRSTQLGSRSVVCHLLDVGGTAAKAARSRSRDHRVEADEPSRPTPAHVIPARSVRRS